MRFTAVFLLVLLAGCNRPAETQPQLPVQAEAKQQPEKKRAPARPRPKVRYQGRTADQWAQDLHDRDWTRCNAGAYALNQIGEEGVPFLLEGMDSRDAQVRGESVHLFPVQLANGHKDELVPRLRRLLDDGSSVVREHTATLIHNAGLVELTADVESAMIAEQDASVRRTLQTAFKKLKRQ